MNTSNRGFPTDQAKAPVNHAPVDELSKTSSQDSPAVPRVVVTCPTCKATLKVRRVYIGNAVQCKQCGQIFTVPADVDTQPMPAVNHTARDLPSRSPQANLDARSQQSGSSHNVLLDQVAQFIASSNDLRSAHDRLQAEHDELTEKVKLQEDDLCAVRAERDALSRDLSEHSSELDAARFELVQWAQRIEQSNADLQAACQERDQLGQQLEQCRNDLGVARADLGRSESERRTALDTVEQLRHELADHDALLNAERTERQQLAAELRALRANAEETARVAEQLLSANLNPPEAPLASADELEAARVQAEELKYKLDEADSLYRIMAETLEGAGVQIDLPNRHRDRVEVEF